VDNPSAAKSVLTSEGLIYMEAEVAQVRVPKPARRTGACRGTARRKQYHINYGYVGIEPETNALLLFFGVAEVGRAARILEQAAAAVSS
jgi:hypothetical protein